MKKLYLGLAVIIALGISSLIFFGVISFSNLVVVSLLFFAEEHPAFLKLGTVLLCFLSVIIIVRRNCKKKDKGI